jgi:hypothetical protein
MPTEIEFFVSFGLALAVIAVAVGTKILNGRRRHTEEGRSR